VEAQGGNIIGHCDHHFRDRVHTVRRDGVRLAGSDGDRIFSWQLAAAVRPTLFVFTSLGRLGHDRDGNGGMEGRITVSYRFTRPGQEITLFSRTITIEAYKHAPLPDQLFVEANPARIDAYHEAVARELARSAD
jgi:hypothetical protein